MVVAARGPSFPQIAPTAIGVLPPCPLEADRPTYVDGTPAHRDNRAAFDGVLVVFRDEKMECRVDRAVGEFRRVRTAGAVMAVLLLGSCASEIHRPVRPEYDLRDPSATRRLTAISTVERTGDRTSVPALIELLDDEDEAVRMAAGAALKGMTGHDTGYRAFAPPAERRLQIAQWHSWWNATSRVPPMGAASTTTPPKEAAPDAGAGYTSGGSHARNP